jgi:hypothetical protein
MHGATIKTVNKCTLLKCFSSFFILLITACFSHNHDHHQGVLQNTNTAYSTLFFFCFDVSLTVHLSITLANEQLDAQIF